MKRSIWRHAVAVVWLASGLPSMALASSQSYTQSDFYRVEKIDAHVHLNRDAPAVIQRARADKFRMLSINVDYQDFGPLEDQQRVAQSLHARYPAEVAFAATFSVLGFDEPGWADNTVRGIDQALAQGAVAVKFWKNIGMSLRGRDGKLVMLDDARLDPVFDHLAARKVVVLGHQAEPKNCWLPLEEMTVKGDQGYFQTHPQYHMYRQPQMPSHEAQLAARDARLRRMRNPAFVGVHLASLEWSVDAVAQFLEQFPSASVDVAARLSHLQHQSQRNHRKVRDFFIRYQDRVLYGSDMALGVNQSDAEFQSELHAVWLADWRYFNSHSSMTVVDLDGPVRGLALPKAVVDKLYRLNAMRVFADAWRRVKARHPAAARKDLRGSHATH